MRSIRHCVRTTLLFLLTIALAFLVTLLLARWAEGSPMPKQLSFADLSNLPPLAVEIKRVTPRSYQIFIEGQPRYQGRTFQKSAVDARLSVLRRSYAVTVQRTEGRSR